jgi:hypothetical protein
MHRPDKVVVSAVVDRDVRAELEREAEEGDRTLSAQVRRVLVEHVRQAEQRAAAA